MRKKSKSSVCFYGLIICISALFCTGIAETKKEPISKTTSVTKQKTDTLIVIAQLEEIPGTMPGNDLYNYVYIMKYKIKKIEKGTYKEQTVLVGHYNPLISRSRVKDKMDIHVNGNVEQFNTGAIHRLVLVNPLDIVWKDAVEDEYFDSPLTKYFAVQTDISK